MSLINNLNRVLIAGVFITLLAITAFFAWNYFKQPSLNVGTIPTGAYIGDPLIPEKDLETVAVNRLLIGHKNADSEAIKLITKILFERRLELLRITPLAGFITQPNWGAGTFIPLHKGAISFYDREKPSYFVENADFIALIMSLLIMFGSTLLGLRKKSILQPKKSCR